MKKDTKKPPVDKLHSKHMKGDRAYELEKAQKALEKAKALEAQRGKDPVFVPKGVSGQGLKSWQELKKY